jgi:hypothetical protein
VKNSHIAALQKLNVVLGGAVGFLIEGNGCICAVAVRLGGYGRIYFVRRFLFFKPMKNNRKKLQMEVANKGTHIVLCCSCGSARGVLLLRRLFR